jgi:hypothetical protein
MSDIIVLLGEKRLGLEIAFFDGIGEQVLDVRPEARGSIADVAVAVDDLVEADAMGAPRGALGVVVVEDGLEAVEGGGKAGLGRLPGFEFVPELAKLGGLVRRQDAEDTIGGTLLALGLIAVSLGVVYQGVASVDFDNVVDEEHADDAGDIDGLDGIFGEDRGDGGDMPRVLGTVFAARFVGEKGLAENEFEFVNFKEEAQLGIEAVHGRAFRGKTVGEHFKMNRKEHQEHEEGGKRCMTFPIVGAEAL